VECCGEDVCGFNTLKLSGQPCANNRKLEHLLMIINLFVLNNTSAMESNPSPNMLFLKGLGKAQANEGFTTQMLSSLGIEGLSNVQVWSVSSVTVARGYAPCFLLDLLIMHLVATAAKSS